MFCMDFVGKIVGNDREMPPFASKANGGGVFKVYILFLINSHRNTRDYFSSLDVIIYTNNNYNNWT